MPKPARKTDLSLLNGRQAMLRRGSKLRRYVCRRPFARPSWLFDTTEVQGIEVEGAYPASAGAENPGGAALQALKDCRKARTGPPNFLYRLSLTITAFVLGSKLA